MCGRYQFLDDERFIEAKKLKQEIKKKYTSIPFDSGEIFPGQYAPIIKEGKESPEMFMYEWGIKPTGFKTSLINARSESVKTKPSFAEAYKNNRIIVPATGFYEWSRDKKKYLFFDEDIKLLYMAGIAASKSGRGYFAIITTQADETVSKVHDRMPLLLDKHDVVSWLSQTMSADSLLSKNPARLIIEEA